MKKLIYFQLALFIVLMSASCNKDNSVNPIVNKDNSVKSIVNPPPADTTTVTLINHSSTGYHVAFLGETRYIVDMPANGRQDVTIKAGIYDINVYPTSIAASHTITWGDLAPVISARALFTSVPIKAAEHPELLIY